LGRAEEEEDEISVRISILRPIDMIANRKGMSEIATRQMTRSERVARVRRRVGRRKEGKGKLAHGVERYETSEDLLCK
jgi:hypothetical protein